MRRNRLLLLVAFGLAVGVLVVLRARTPTSTKPEQRPAPPVEEPREPALQADAEGYYVPGYRFTVSRFRFTGFSLRPEALVSFAQTTAGIEQPAACFEALIRADTVHLRCDYPQVGTVAIDGKFLTRLATNSLDTAVLSAVVTVRSASGEIVYSARDSFVTPRGLGRGSGQL
ncbi:MAG: hypothetical protein AUH69_06750 [Actinobacteria bacterium 13_1_40CM_4_65_12]|nr:MAG: hypothetical protein AUH41_07670 [Gemmatimonadetes bacterium 13_1_40CM_66_11]OLC66559.1 MAG: hypothetical protein AUH69_06750 [Actinobacteria bacterium 13_1_40CM_4_65_12]